MASLLNSLLGQQDAPELTTPTLGEIYKAIARFAPKLAETAVDYNKVLAPGMAEAQRMGEDVYDPNRGAIREASGAALLNQVNNPFAVDPRLAALWRQQGIETIGGASGRGGAVSDAAIRDMFTSFGAKAQDRADNILRTGLGYGSNTANLWQPQGLGVTPGDFGSGVMSLANQKNAINTYMSDLDYQNDMNLINRPLEIGGKMGNIAGQIVGGIFGTSGIGGAASGIMGGGGGAPMDTQMWASPRGTQWNLPGGGSFTR